MDNLKFIIDEINALFQADYNCSSFSLLTPVQLLQIVCDVMKELGISDGVSDKINVQDQEKGAYEILSTLEAIKYIPDYKIFPADFRNGLIQGETRILHPILTFLLTNKDNVKRRHYLSKYVNKIDVPEDILEDAQVSVLNEKYGKLMDDFWKVYMEHKKERENAMESSELESDVWAMKTELLNLNKRLEVQKDKLSAEGESADRLQCIKDQCVELKRKEKLSKQLQEEKSKVESLCDEIKRCTRRDKIENLEDFLERSENHKYTESMYASMVKEIDGDLSGFKSVAEDNEPDYKQIEDLEVQMRNMQNDISTLNAQKAAQFDETVESYLNQIKYQEKKKSMLSKQILKIQLKNEEILSKIDDICSLLGGDVLHGRSLKEYVAKLREMSLVYKQYKKYLNSMSNEYGVLGRTVEILHIQNPDLAQKLQEHKNFNKQLQEECDTTTNVKEIQNKYQLAFKDYESARKDILIDKIKFDKVKNAYDDLLSTYKQLKTKFDESAGQLNEEVEKLSKGFKTTQDLIEMEMEDLNKYVDEAEHFKDCMLRFSQDIIENDGDVPFVDTMMNRVANVEQRRDELREKLLAKKEVVNKELEEMNMLGGVREMILMKIKESNMF